MYKVSIDLRDNKVNGISRIDDNAWIPLDPANTDYAWFKKQILADEAQLQDSDGNVMAPDAAKAFVATLP